MARYRKKPVVIEAMQILDEENVRSIVRWGQAHGALMAEPFLATPEHVLSILTPEGEMFAGLNDYVIKGVQGEFYPCKPGIFAATYEPVEESS